MGKTRCIWILLVLLTRSGWAVEDPVTRQGFLDPTQISLEELLQIEMISLTKRPESRTTAAAAVHLGWRPRPSLTVAVVGQNLLTDHHAEFGGGSSEPTEIERSVYGKVVWRW